MSPEQATCFALAYGVVLFLVVTLFGILLLLRISRSKKSTSHHTHK